VGAPSNEMKNDKFSSNFAVDGVEMGLQKQQVELVLSNSRFRSHSAAISVVQINSKTTIIF
jgi:hypothetical protein